jgi:hypothetical protein
VPTRTPGLSWAVQRSWLMAARGARRAFAAADGSIADAGSDHPPSIAIEPADGERSQA